MQKQHPQHNPSSLFLLLLLGVYSFFLCRMGVVSTLTFGFSSSISKFIPQFLQNLLPSGFSVPHSRQNIVYTPIILNVIFISIINPIPPINPVMNLKLLLLSLSPKSCVNPSIATGISSIIDAMNNSTV